MRRSIALGLTLALWLAGCGQPETYPVSGDACGPDDPVKTVDVNQLDCAPEL